jgi:hypothetical protein
MDTTTRYENVKNQTRFEEGYKARMAGRPRYYGCHTGMRSTLESDKADFFAGWDAAQVDVKEFDLNIAVRA